MTSGVLGTSKEKVRLLLKKMGQSKCCGDALHSSISFNACGKRRNDSTLIRPDAKEFAFPEMTRLVLQEYLGFQGTERTEKVRWSIPVHYSNHHFIFEHRKLGFCIIHDAAPESLVQEVIGKVKKAILHLERDLREEAKRCLEEGDVGMQNLYRHFTERYTYFRKQVSECFSKPDPPPVVRADIPGVACCTTFSVGVGRMQGMYNAIAMLDAYFGRLEFILVGLLSFTAFDPSSKRLSELVRNDWGNKFRTLFDFQTSPEASRVYEDLVHIKEAYRNPYAHGGLSRDGAPFGFNIPGFHGLPSDLTRALERPDLFAIVFSETEATKTFASLVAGLDRAEKLLRDTFPLPMEYLEGGLAISFREKDRRAHAMALKSRDEFRSYMDYISDRDDAHANMEY